MGIDYLSNLICLHSNQKMGASKIETLCWEMCHGCAFVTIDSNGK